MMPPRTPHTMEAREIVMPPCVCVRGLGIVDAVGAKQVTFTALSRPAGNAKSTDCNTIFLPTSRRQDLLLYRLISR